MATRSIVTMCRSPDIGCALLLLILFSLTCAPARAINTGELETVFRGIPHDALYDIAFQGQHGISVGAWGLVLMSEDGGETWQRHLTGLTENAILDVSLTSGRGIMVGQAGLVLVKDAGGEWKWVDSGTENRLLSVDLRDTGLAVAVGGFGAVLISTDFGNSWKPVTLNWEEILNDFLEPHLYDVHISAAGHITIVGEFALVLRSLDTGLSWEVMHKGDSSLFALHMTDAGTGIAVGQRGAILKTDNHGDSWRTVAADTQANLLGIWVSEQGEALATGIRSMIYSTDAGQNWRHIESRELATGWYQGIGARPSDEKAANSALFTVGYNGSISKLNR